MSLSLLAGWPRRTTLSFASARTTPIASASNGVFVVQTRGKATAKPKVRQSQTRMKPKKISRDGDGPTAKGKAQKLGAFMALGKGQLNHPTFETEARPELDLPVFGKDTLQVGEAMAFAHGQNDPMRKFGLPRSMLLEFRLLSKPASVVRAVTDTTLQTLDAAASQPSSATRAVLTGASGCGKSFLLLQAVEHCVAKQWIVLYVPRAISLVNSSTTYNYDMRTQIYSQPAFAHQTLQRLLGTNNSILNSLRTTREVYVERRDVIPVGTSLAELISVGNKDQSVAPTVLDAVLAELGQQTEYPVLMAIDDFQALYCESTYRDPLFSRIKPWHLSMPRILLEYASGKKSFARGAVLGALSTQNTQFRTPDELREALGLKHDLPLHSRARKSALLQEYAQGLQKIEVPAQLTLEEASALFEIWMKEKALYGVSESSGSVADEAFLAKYTESNGNARNFVQKGLLASLSYHSGN